LGSAMVRPFCCGRGTKKALFLPLPQFIALINEIRL